MIAIPRRRVLQGLSPPNCVESVRLEEEQTFRVDPMSCDCTQVIRPCIAQAADKTFTFVAPTSTDFDIAAEIEFRIWENAGGAQLLAKSLTGGDITIVNGNSFTLSVTNAESAAMTKGTKHCAAWIETLAGKRFPVGAGPFLVRDIGDIDA